MKEFNLRGFIFLFLILLIFSPGIVNSTDTAGNINLGISGGWISSKSSPDSTFGRPSIGVNLSRYFSIDLTILSTFSRSGSTFISLDSSFIPLPEQRLTPFFVIGAGAGIIDEDQNTSTKGLFNAGGGLQYSLSEDTAVRIDLRNYVLGGRSDIAASLGFVFYFNPSRETSPPSEPEKQGATEPSPKQEFLIAVKKRQQQLVARDTGTQRLDTQEATSVKEDIKGAIEQKTEEDKPIREAVPPKEDISPVSARADIEAGEVSSVMAKEGAIKKEGSQEALEERRIKEEGMEGKDSITRRDEAVLSQEIRKPEEKVASKGVEAAIPEEGKLSSQEIIDVPTKGMPPQTVEVSEVKKSIKEEEGKVQIEQKKIEAVQEQQQLIAQDTRTQRPDAQEETSAREDVEEVADKKTEVSRPITESPEENISSNSAQADSKAAEDGLVLAKEGVHKEGIEETFEEKSIKEESIKGKDYITPGGNSDTVKKGISDEATLADIKKPEEIIIQRPEVEVAQEDSLSQISTEDKISERPAKKGLPVKTEDKALTAATFVADKGRMEAEKKKKDVVKDTGAETTDIETKPESVRIKKTPTEKKLGIAGHRISEQKWHAADKSKKGLKPKKAKRVYEKAPFYGEAMLAEAVKSPAGLQDIQQAEKVPQKPLNQTEEEPIKLYKNSMELSIEFNVRETEIGAEQEGLLLKFMEMLRDKKYKKIIIEGHACAHGNKKLNLLISKKRASSAKRFLQAHGIKRDISIKYFGEERLRYKEIPTPDNINDPHVKANRRVRIIAHW